MSRPDGIRNVIILAAGMGMRLRPLTETMPKAMVSCAGWPLLSYAIEFAKGALDPGGSLVVVAGYRHEMVENLVRAEVPDAVVAYNPDYRKGNLWSLIAGLPRTTGGFLLMNVDHIYPFAFLDRLMNTPGSVVAAVDRDRTLGPDDMKVRVGLGGEVRAISKTLDRCDAGYIGMTLVRPPAREAYLRAVEAARRSRADAAVAEDVLQAMADAGERVDTCDLSGLSWLEVDTFEDLEVAEKRLMEDDEFLKRTWT